MKINQKLNKNKKENEKKPSPHFSFLINIGFEVSIFTFIK